MTIKDFGCTIPTKSCRNLNDKNLLKNDKKFCHKYALKLTTKKLQKTTSNLIYNVMLMQQNNHLSL